MSGRFGKIAQDARGQKPGHSRAGRKLGKLVHTTTANGKPVILEQQSFGWSVRGPITLAKMFEGANNFSSKKEVLGEIEKKLKSSEEPDKENGEGGSGQKHDPNTGKFT